MDSSDTAVTIAEDTEEETEDVVCEDVGKLLILDLEETNTDYDITQVKYKLPPQYTYVCCLHNQFDSKQGC